MKDSTKRIFTIVMVIVLIIFGLLLGGVFLGIQSLGSILIFLIGFFFVIGILGLVAYAIYWLFFKKQKYDATYMNKKSLISAGKISKPDSINDLYLSGDRGHSRVRIGKIIGYCRIQTVKKTIDYDEQGNPVLVSNPNKQGKLMEKFTLEKEEQDVFTVQRHGFPLSFFEEPVVIRVRPQDHDDLVGDISLRGFSIIKISEYYYLNNDYLDVRKIDYSILLEANRSVFHEHLRDYKTLLDMASGLDSGHKKKIEEKNLYEIPQIPIQRVQQ